MHLSELTYPFPDELIATEKTSPSRVMWVDDRGPRELSIKELLARFQKGDLLLVNNTKVLPRRVFSQNGFEILFLRARSPRTWEVLCPASRVRDNQDILLPENITARVIGRGRPQLLAINQDLSDDYFQRVGEMPLPPYIQKARGERHARSNDQTSYQSSWAEIPGSLAAPTASLHFTKNDLVQILLSGARVEKITLHVGIGTFLPIEVDELEGHQMHSEWVEVSAETWRAVQETKKAGRQVWALGTTVTRAVESIAVGILPADANGNFAGFTDLFLKSPEQFQVITRLLTNFHQPQSTLLALVGAFAGLKQVKASYAWAIERKFKLFSYGDLTVWSRE